MLVVMQQKKLMCLKCRWFRWLVPVVPCWPGKAWAVQGTCLMTQQFGYRMLGMLCGSAARWDVGMACPRLGKDTAGLLSGNCRSQSCDGRVFAKHLGNQVLKAPKKSIAGSVSKLDLLCRLHIKQSHLICSMC